MTAVEFIKQYGWEEAKKHLRKMDAENWHNVFFNDLKQLVDAWELVNQFDDIEQAKSWIPAMDKDMPYCVKGSRVRFMRDELKQAIELVESIK